MTRTEVQPFTEDSKSSSQSGGVGMAYRFPKQVAALVVKNAQATGGDAAKATKTIELEPMYPKAYPTKDMERMLADDEMGVLKGNLEAGADFYRNLGDRDIRELLFEPKTERDQPGTSCFCKTLAIVGPGGSKFTAWMQNVYDDWQDVKAQLQAEEAAACKVIGDPAIPYQDEVQKYFDFFTSRGVEFGKAETCGDICAFDDIIKNMAKDPEMAKNFMSAFTEVEKQVPPEDLEKFGKAIEQCIPTVWCACPDFLAIMAAAAAEPQGGRRLLETNRSSDLSIESINKVAAIEAAREAAIAAVRGTNGHGMPVEGVVKSKSARQSPLRTELGLSIYKQLGKFIPDSELKKVKGQFPSPVVKRRRLQLPSPEGLNQTELSKQTKEMDEKAEGSEDVEAKKQDKVEEDEEEDSFRKCNEAESNATIFRHFKSKEDITNWIANADYGAYAGRSPTSAIDRLCGAVIFENDPTQEAIPKFTVRANVTYWRGGSDQGQPLHTWLTKAHFAVDERWISWSTLTWYMQSNFLLLQHAVQAFILDSRQVDAARGDVFNHFVNQPHFVPMRASGASYNGWIEGLVDLLTMPLTISLVFAPAAVMLGYQIIRERQSRQRELMRLMGLFDGSLHLSWILLYIILNFGISLGCTAMIFGVLMRHSNPLMVFLMFFMFSMASSLMGMVVSTLFSSERMGAIAIFGAFVLSSFTQEGIETYSPPSEKLAASLVPTTAFQLGFRACFRLEVTTVGCGFHTMYREVENYTVGGCLGMLFVDMFIWFLIFYYLDQVVPHDVGVVQKPWFFLTKQWWADMIGAKTTIAPVDEQDYDGGGTTQGAIIENETSEMLKRCLQEERCVKIRKLCKYYTTASGGTVHAVDGISMTMYEGECFCLLGHNGAGKTTTLSVVCGIFPQTSGQVSVCGKRIPEEIKEARKVMGFCPQHNVLWDKLSCLEHMQCFGALSGADFVTIQGQASRLLNEVGLADKKYARVSTLSGGMKRKLSVAIAFMGEPKLIVLDEPTSGMDPSARHQMWESVKRLREGRILCLTTHYMDEADALSDRIGIMAAGRVACCGSSTFLKQRFGIGYTISFGKNTDATPDGPFLEICKKYCGDGVKVLHSQGTELVVQLPFNSVEVFPKMIPDIDKTLPNMGGKSYGLGVTTLEEVFLKVMGGEEANDVENIGKSAQVIGKANNDDETLLDVGTHSVTPLNLKPSFPRTLVALIDRRVRFGRHDLKMIFCQLLLPNLCLVAFCAILTAVTVLSLPPLEMDTSEFNIQNVEEGPFVPTSVAGIKDDILSGKISRSWQSQLPTGVDKLSFTDQLERVALLTTTTTSPPADAETTAFGTGFGKDVMTPGTVPWNTEGRKWWAAEKAYLEYSYSKREVAAAAQYGGVCYTDDRTTVFPNTTAHHAAPTFFSRHASAILRDATAKLPKPIQDIMVTNHPFEMTSWERSRSKSIGGLFMALILIIAYSFIPGGIVTYVVMEKEKEFKHQLVISGCGHVGYWFSNIIFDAIFGVFAFAGTMIIFYAYDLEVFLSDPIIKATCSLLLLYGPAAGAFSYFMSFFFTKSGSALVVMLVLCSFFGLIGTIVVFILDLIEDTKEAAEYMQWFFRLIPSYCLGNGFFRISIFEPFMEVLGLGPFSGKILNEQECFDVLCIYLAGDDVICLAIDIVLYLGLIILMDWAMGVPAIQGKIEGRVPPAPPSTLEDEDVLDEKDRVAELDPKTQILHAINVRKVYRRFHNGLIVTVHAVRGISLAMDEGEIFGLLGVNGAGKTTFFKMLCGQFAPSDGKVYVKGLDITKHVDKIRQYIGYCPQFSALLDLLSVREHLSIFGRMKGIFGHQLKCEIDRKMEVMGLTQYANRRAGALSGGNQRKLSCAIATIANPQLIFLDEPSTGVDPIARRHMWGMIKKIAANTKDAIVILSTHSMEEAENLCSRLAVQSAGRLRCLGTSSQIKARYSEGLELSVRFTPPSHSIIQFFCDQWGMQATDICPHFEAYKMAMKTPGRPALLSATAGSPLAAGALETSFGVLAEWLVNEDNVHAMANFLAETLDPKLKKNTCEMRIDVPIDCEPRSLGAPGANRFVQLLGPDGREYESVVPRDVDNGDHYFDDVPDASRAFKIVDRTGSTARFALMLSSLQREGTKSWSLGQLFEHLTDNKEKLNIIDFQISMPTMDQIFNRFANEGMMEARATQKSEPLWEKVLRQEQQAKRIKAANKGRF